MTILLHEQVIHQLLGTKQPPHLYNVHIGANMQSESSYRRYRRGELSVQHRNELLQLIYGYWMNDMFQIVCYSKVKYLI